MLSKKSQMIRLKMKVVALFAFLLIGLLVFRAFDLQIMHGHHHEKKARSQTIASIILEPARGEILDRNLDALAISVKAESLFARPRQVTDKKLAHEKLAEIFAGKSRLLKNRLDSQSAFAFLVRKLPPDDMERVVFSGVLDIPGIDVMQEHARFYPYNTFASPILGYVNIDGVGKLGVEKTFDDLLRGEKITLSGVRDARRKIGLGLSDFDLGEAVGHSLVLTIDKTIQYVADKAIRDAVERAEAKCGIAAVMDPKTGDLLAISQWPSFDANRYSTYPIANLHNAAVEYVYEPGSTMKIVTIGAALDAGVVKPEDKFSLNKGTYTITNITIHDSHRYKEETFMSVEEILVKSSNVGTVKVAEALGAKTLYDYLKAFGFGERTGVALPSESRGLLRHYSKWMPIDFANVAFGQGLNGTVMQVLQMTAAVANDGLLVPPRLVRGVVTPAGEFVEADPDTSDQRRVFKASTAKTLRSIMVNVVGDEGTASKAAIEGVKVAGKTGTAQRIDPETKRYSKKLWSSWFVGMVPAENPSLAVVVMIDKPSGRHYYGGEVAAPPFREIVSEILRLNGDLAVDPMQETEPKKAEEHARR